MTTPIVAELEAALQQGSSEKRLETLRRVTDLFLNESVRLSEDQVGVFDQVFSHLSERVEQTALAQLSAKLGPVDNAPAETVRRLARHDDISVAQPILAESNRLTEGDLIEIAKSKGQDHLLAMSARKTLSGAVTDVLVERGDQKVAHRLTENVGAQFSETGFVKLARRAEGDDTLTMKLGQRIDLPPATMEKLLQDATDAVRAKLLAAAPPENQEKIQRALAAVAGKIAREVRASFDFTRSDNVVQELNRQGKLNEPALVNFALTGQIEEAISTLAMFCQAPPEVIEKLMLSDRHDGVILVCKAAKLGWPTSKAILQARAPSSAMSESDLAEAEKSFAMLSFASAQRALRFMLVQRSAKKQAS